MFLYLGENYDISPIQLMPVEGRAVVEIVLHFMANVNKMAINQINVNFKL